MISKLDIIFTNGCFDILHRAHFELLKYCKTLGGKVVVGLNSDDSIKRLKGDSRPYNTAEDRKFMLESCKYVDQVIVFEEDTPLELIRHLKPSFIVKGSQYEGMCVVGSEISEVKFFNHLDGYSSTDTLEKINNDLCI
jgi:D-beta-D-heptose 7-phosphate kinase/D-beta-D-heptose 1-phosphate adenosyltransferase